MATETIPADIFAVGFASFLYLQLWMLITSFAVTGALELYGVDWEPSPRHSFFILLRNFRKPRPNPIFLVCISYVIAVYGFGIAYVFVSRLHANSFNVGSLDLISGIYFSAVTIATVGYGDIVPTASTTKLMVIGEILVGLLYAVFFFSIVAAYIRDATVRK